MRKNCLMMLGLLMFVSAISCHAEGLDYETYSEDKAPYKIAIDAAVKVYEMEDMDTAFVLDEILFFDVSENDIIPWGSDDKYAVAVKYSVDGNTDTMVLLYDGNETRIEFEGNMNDLVGELYQGYIEDAENTVHSLDISFINECLGLEEDASDDTEEETKWLSSEQVFPEDNWEYYPLDDKNIDAKIPTMDSIIKAIAENAICDGADGAYVYFWPGEDGYARGNSMGSFLTYTSVLEELGFELKTIDPSLLGESFLEVYEIGYKSQPLAIVSFSSVEGAGSGTIVGLLE